MASNQFIVASPPTDAISALKFSPDPNSTRVVVSSWDKNVYLYELRDENGNVGEGKLLQKFEHRAPVLDVCFGATEDEIYTAGLDWDVRKIDVATSTQTVLSSHEAGVRSVVYSKEHQLVISASWDSTLHVHRIDAPDSIPSIIPLPSKPFSMSLTATKLVVAMASRALHIYDLKALSVLTAQLDGTVPNKVEVEPWQRRESSLKFMTRCVACMPDDAGYASSSIEGRVAVEWFDPSAESQARKYAFKCHRQTADDVDVVYPVNTLAFHPVHGTFASGGGDGVVALWDGIAKRRIRQYQKYQSSVAAVDFSGNGKYLAIAVSPGFEDGKDDVVEGAVKIYVRELGETEAKGKGAK
ncbi:nuclear pore complex subunit [Aspergillus pseudonomiae]|uniref:Nuclear pore complex subunit n=2 Tax=Aspergillus subgen. Circumdati TaxID=2720871 RepID=A0A0L1IZH9_ASPN3|nr:nuclear pore complex subunit [Aspergillus nomiae NRRL 13137]XP_031947150.1 nuclear pore complex subunit [Aspergillus pseudonomiae]KAB8263290.1 nuclear pore complex subunit [Aspergillus pseudonomiae]KAE8409831.1 nuclear pore complex subunit [Aspergillus pseudonomiae]KNG84941.1 nuclear pore complex subunit [Aspergillus nomiae NRRL 13137]